MDVLFSSILARFISIPARQPASDDCSVARMRVLWIIEHRGAVSPGEIAHVLGISPSTATELVDQLVRAGYVRREPSAEDRRRAILTLRAPGRRILDDFAKRRREKFERLLRGLSASDARRLADALEVVNEIVARGAP